MAKTVMIVDDVSFVRKTLATLLKDAGYLLVGEASDGAEAIKMYAQLRPDVVTMDVVMPAMSGIEATRRIVKMDNSARVIIVSAMGQENLILEAISAGAKDYVLKPFSSEELLRAVERAVGGDRGASQSKAVSSEA